MQMSRSSVRLWRARRRHNHLDATLLRRRGAWMVAYSRDGRALVAREFADEGSAREDAAGRLRELQRAGWVVHW